MDVFEQRVLAHTEHINKVAEHCTTEETTKQALILPLLDILGFSAFDPTKVRAEHQSDFPGAKIGERVDYALFCNGVPVMFIEAKPCIAKLDNHCPQLSRYYNATPEVTVAAITNGREWRFFTDLVNKNIMDSQPFLTLHLDKPAEDVAERLLRFHHDQFRPDALRALAEESIYLSAFRETLRAMLQDCDTDFVKYVANRANIQRTFTVRFLDEVQPIVKRALAQSVSELVATSLNKPAISPAPEVVVEPVPDPEVAIVDPVNPKIVTTAAERQVMAVVSDLLQGEDLQGRDTESYFSVLYQGRPTRWLIRYIGDRRKPLVTFNLKFSQAHKDEISRARLMLVGENSVQIDRPEHLARVVGLLVDCLEFCKNEENFKRQTSGGEK